MSLDNVFDKFLGNEAIFSNRSVLSIAFTPENIPHREEQINELGRMLAPSLRGDKPSNIFVYGRTGTGKSLITRLVGEQLEKRSRSNGNLVKVVYLNCKMKTADTEYRLLASLSKEFGVDVPFTGLPTDKVYDIFFDCIDSKKQSVIIIIDEIDALIQKNGDEILYNLTRMNQDLKNSRVSLIGITNDLGFIENLDPRIRSSLSEEELIFPPYNAIQLQDILRNRSKNAFKESSLQEGVIEKCAALAAQEHGDARRALDLLRVSAELAERTGSSKILIEHVDKAEDKIDIDRTVELVKAQPKQSQAVLWGIIKLGKKGNIETSDVIDKYHEVCQENGIKPLTQRRISDLIGELDMFGMINTRVVSKGRYGRTKVVSMNVSEHVYNKLTTTLQQSFL